MSKEKEQYTELIRQLIPISELPPQIQNEVINKADIIEIRKKAYVFEQGDRDEFSYYCLEGEIELLANNQQHNLITGGSDGARYAMSQLQPRQFSAKARTKLVVLKISRDMLDKMVVIQEKEQSDFNEFGFVDMEEVDINDLEVDWTTRILQSELFAKMPTGNIHALFAMLEPIDFKAGENVITQGEIGEHYYIIQEGSCQVSRKPPKGDKDIKLAVLKAGDSFGEEALISETNRNATVSMITDGVLMQLSKETFEDLIKKPTLQSVTFAEASKLIGEGNAEWLDVRFKNEHESSAIEGSRNIPLNMLRLQADKLDQEKLQIIYCDTGGRSSTGAFLLTGLGFDVSYLEGGLVNNPQAVTNIEKVVEAEPEPPPKKEPVEVAKEAPVKAEADLISTVDEITRQNIDPEVKSSMLEAELEKTNTQLKYTAKEKQKTDDEYVKKMHAEVERRLQEERAKIEVAKKAAGVEARRLRAWEEAKIKKMQEEAAKKIQKDQKQLEEVYTRNAEEMEKLQRMKKEAAQKLKEEKEKLDRQAEGAKLELADAQRVKKEVEASKKILEEEALKHKKEQDELEKKIESEAREELQRMKKEAEQKLKEEKEKLDRQAEGAKSELADAQRIKKEVEASKKLLEEEALRHKKEQDELEKKIEREAREKLEVERRKLMQQFTNNQEELEQAKQEKEAADAARKAAKEEADRIIAEYKAKHDEDRAIAEEQLKAERLKLEEEQQKIRETLKEINIVKAEAAAAKKQALEEARRLKEKQKDEEIAQSNQAQESLKVEIKVAEEKVSKANKEIAQVQQAQVKVIAAKNINQEDLIKQKAHEEEMRKQLEEDLSGFREELEEKEKGFVSMTSQMEHMKRIKKRADNAKLAVSDANVHLLDDIAAQLGKDS